MNTNLREQGGIATKEHKEHKKGTGIRAFLPLWTLGSFVAIVVPGKNRLAERQNHGRTES